MLQLSFSPPLERAPLPALRDVRVVRPSWLPAHDVPNVVFQMGRRLFELLEMPGAQVEFPDGAGNIETNVPRGHCNVRVQIADHNHPFRHRDLHERREMRVEPTRVCAALG